VVLDQLGANGPDDPAVSSLVRRAQAGDRLAFADLYLRFFDCVYRYLFIAVKNEQDAQEIAQEVFTKLLGALPTYAAERGEFRAWLFSMVRRMALDHLRKAKRSDTVAPDAMAQYLPDAADRTIAIRESVDLAGIVDSLPESQRRVVVLRFAFDLTAAEIGEVVGATPDAVRHTQHRALKAIAAHLTRERELLQT
jgi:RNA polymerase sigma-70 factor, ECF subfamily